MTVKSRKREAENQRWHEQHQAERTAATRTAASQRNGQGLVDAGLRSAPLPSIADALDRVDPYTSRVFYPEDRARTVPKHQEEIKPVITNDAIRSSERSKPFIVAKKRALRIPADLNELLPDIDYIAEVNDDGLLFRPAHLFNNTRPRPAWTNGSSNGATAKR